MLTAKDIAMFFLHLDDTGDLFNGKDLMELNGRTFYKGNARLNKFLHLAQNIFYAKTGSLLFEDPLYAYDNGAVVPDIQETYKLLLAKKNSYVLSIPEDIESFLIKLFAILKTAPVEKLIELSHEDSEWIRKHNYYQKEDQKMDTPAHLEEYKEQYEDVIQLMDRMDS